MNKGFILIVLLFSGFVRAAISQDNIDLKVAERVADKVIRDTRFAFQLVPRTNVLGMQVIDFRYLLLQQNQRAYALHYAKVNSDTSVYFDFYGTGHIKIWLNRELVYTSHASQAANPPEIAYGRFRFNEGFTLKMRKGSNEILVGYEYSPSDGVVLLRPVLKTGDLNTAVDFTATSPSSWLFTGPFDNTGRLTPENEIKTYYEAGGKMRTWEQAPQKFLPELVIDSTATYQRDSYADWNYSNGATIWSILALDEVAGNTKYLDFVRKYTSFTLENVPYFKWQYDSLYAFRGSYHRIFRQTMLDDSGTPALPFAELYLKAKDPALKQFIDPIAQYVSRHQMRLPDGTFCRPEPVEFTVWADDLFMSVPFLLRMAKATGEQRYYDDAAAQYFDFQKLLRDPGTGLYKHGWFSKTNERSVAYWGRANGWVAWATAELLTWLPPDHKSYRKILKGYQEQMAVLLKYQAASGMWHQVLDRPDSYEETSCTAIFSLAMARGVRKGWLNDSYKKYAVKAWNAVKKNIEADGTVHGICRGTEIGFDQQFYLDRKTIDHDPRGLGAVITAGIEISKLR